MGNPGTRWLKPCICCVLALASSNAVNAGMCKWVEENGSVHYAETCPKGIEGNEINIQPPPAQAQIDEASKRYVGTQRENGEQDDSSVESPDLSDSVIAPSRSKCIDARLNLEALAQNLPVYYSQFGYLQSELHRSVRLEHDHGGGYLDAGAINRERKRWSNVEQANCSPAVLESGIRSELREKKKQRQQRECEFWRTELEYMERNKSFHKERLDLKKLFNAKCK